MERIAMTNPPDTAIATNSGAMRQIVVDGIESTERRADPNPNPETDTGLHLLVYRDLVTAQDQAWPMQLYPKPGDGPLRSLAYSCEPLPTAEMVYRLGLDMADDLLERVTVAVTRDGLPVLSSHSYLPAHLARNHQWRSTQIGQLAAPGLPVQLDDIRIHGRMATLAETDALAIDGAAAMSLVCCPMTITDLPQPVRAGLLIKAPGHRTFFSARPDTTRTPIQPLR